VARDIRCAARHALVSRLLVMIHHGTAPMCYLLVIISLVIFSYFVERSYIKLGHLCYVRLEPRWFGCNLSDTFMLHVCEPLINSILVVGKHRYCLVHRMNALIDALDEVV
jgi:hypothetical protein